MQIASGYLYNQPPGYRASCMRRSRKAKRHLSVVNNRKQSFIFMFFSATRKSVKIQKSPNPENFEALKPTVVILNILSHINS